MSDRQSLTLPGDCGVRTIRSLHTEIAAALHVATDLKLDCRDVARADIAFVQLVLSATRTAERQAKRVALTNVPEAVLNVFARSGLGAHAPFIAAS